MTAASGTPLILSILSLVVSLVVGVGAVIMARANLQRQIQVAAREAWMREFREKVAILLAGRKPIAPLGLEPREQWRLSKLDDAVLPAYQAIRLLLAERRARRRYSYLQMACQVPWRATPATLPRWRRPSCGVSASVSTQGQECGGRCRVASRTGGRRGRGSWPGVSANRHASPT